MKVLAARALSAAFVFILFSCSEELDIDLSPPDIPIAQLLSSPDTVLVEGRRLWLSTYMWRDFQPISPPDGKPLIAILVITAVDTIQLPSSITSDAVWIVNNNQVWKSWLSDHNVPPNSPNSIKKIAEDGPKWGPCDSCVSVIVRVYDSNRKEYFLLAPDQNIGSTWSIKSAY